jgi:DNA polymerase III delta prime subunit
MSLETAVWAEKWRPQTVDDCIIPDKVKREIKELMADGNIPHLLMSGSAGTGKTTLARAIVNEMGGELLFINASLESGIDTVRTKVMQYSSTVSFSGNQKFVLFDEFDGMSRNSMESLRGIVEEFKNVRFFFTCNYKNRIIDAIQSRTTAIDFKVSSGDRNKLALQFFKRVVGILDKEGVTYDKKVVAELVNKHFPDFRRTLNELQRYSASGTIDAGILVNQSKESFAELFTFLKEKNFPEMRKWVGKNTDIEAATLFRDIYDNACDLIEPKSIPQMVLILADYQNRTGDPEIVVAAAMTELMANVAWK